MAKKVRKPRSKSPRTYGRATQPTAPVSPQEKQVPDASTAPSSAARPVQRSNEKSTGSVRSGKVDFASEYAYVLTDLRRIFILAGVMLVVLIALNFIVQ